MSDVRGSCLSCRAHKGNLRRHSRTQYQTRLGVGEERFPVEHRHRDAEETESNGKQVEAHPLSPLRAGPNLPSSPCGARTSSCRRSHSRNWRTMALSSSWPRSARKRLTSAAVTSGKERLAATAV